MFFKFLDFSISFSLLIIIFECHYVNMPMLFNPLESHFYIVKLGVSGVLIFIFASKIDCGYPLEPPHLGGCNKYSQSLLSEICCFNKHKNCSILH